MTEAQLEVQLVAVAAAVACAVPGVFLLLRRLALMSDAISHTVLLGIVVSFLISGDLGSPLLALGAAVTGLLTVVVVDLLRRSGLVREDAAIGLTFPFLFSIAVILIARHAGNVHLDTDAVLLGELALAPLNRLVVGEHDLGPAALFVLASVAALNAVFVTLFYKELKLGSFDPELAAVLGLAPGAVHLMLMTSVSVTALAAFDAVGSILVVGLMIAPPATAYLLVESVLGMLLASAALGAGAAVAGYWLASLLDASIAGAMATTCGVMFGTAVLLAPGRGVIAVQLRRARQRRQLAVALVARRVARAGGRVGPASLADELGWGGGALGQALAAARRAGLVTVEGERIVLTPAGRASLERSDAAWSPGGS